MKKVFALLPVEDFWRPMLAAIFAAVLLAALLTFRLGTLTPGFSQTEHQQRTASATTEALADNPMHIHHKLGQFGLQKFDKQGPAAMRLPSVLIGFVAAVSMFIVLKNWYTVRIAVIGSLLFVTSSWFLHVSRLATPDINYLLPLVLLAGGIWLHKGNFIPFATGVTLLTVLFMLYVPGMVWLIVPLIIWQRRVIRRALRHLGVWEQVVAVLVAIAGLAPLIWSFVFQPDLIPTWLGLPANWPSPLAYLKNILEVPLQIFVRSSVDPTYGIGRLPLLDVFTGFMVMLGLFVSFFRLKLDRTRLMLGVAIVATLLIALDGPVKITFLMPIVYLFATAGVALLLQQWFTVFPRNPVARALGVIIVSAAVLLASYYHISRYFIAWPNVPATKTTFSQRP